MNIRTLKTLAKLRGLSQSDLARAAGVSRQRVSQWFNSDAPTGEVTIRSDHLKALARSLNVDVNDLLNPIVDERGAAGLASEHTRLLWDQLYPDLTSLVIAALNGKKDALARIVQEYGLHESVKFLGKKLWRTYPSFKSFIKPVRRRQLDLIWDLHQNQMQA